MKGAQFLRFFSSAFRLSWKFHAREMFPASPRTSSRSNFIANAMPYGFQWTMLISLCTPFANSVDNNFHADSDDDDDGIVTLYSGPYWLSYFRNFGKVLGEILLYRVVDKRD